MNKSHLLGAMGTCIPILVATTTNAAVVPLESRLGGLAYYDPNLDITWATGTEQGILSWEMANDWAANQVIREVSGWRLPNAGVNGNGAVIDSALGDVPGCKDNEMDYLYWEDIASDSSVLH